MSTFAFVSRNFIRSIASGHGWNSDIYKIDFLSREIFRGDKNLLNLLKLYIYCLKYQEAKSNNSARFASDMMIETERVIHDLISPYLPPNRMLNRTIGPQGLDLDEGFSLEPIKPHLNSINGHFAEWRRHGDGSDFCKWLLHTKIPSIVKGKCAREAIFSLSKNVKYIAADDRKRFLVRIESGLIFNSGNQPYDTSELKSFHSGGGVGIFVMSLDRNIYIYKHVDDFRHSSFLSGGQVICAGEISIQCGVIKSISRASGHYKPSEQCLRAFLSIIRELGIPIDDIRVHTFVTQPSHSVSVADFFNPNSSAERDAFRA